MMSSLLENSIVLCDHTQKHEINEIAHIVLCADKNVIQSLGITIYSVAKHITIPSMFHIFFNGEMPEKDKIRLLDIGEEFSLSISIYWLDGSIFNTLHTSRHISVTAYYRLLVPYVLKERGINHFLYLDTDILCIRDIANIFSMMMDDDMVALVVKDYNAIPANQKWWLEHCRDIGMKATDYFNSGMMFININQYVRYDIGNKAIELAIAKSYEHMDQDVLNILLERKVIFDERHEYNCTMSVPDDLVPDTVKLIHFTGFKKPWKLYTSYWGNDVSQNPKPKHGNTWKYAYYKIWREYAAQSPWHDVPFDAPRNAHEWRWVSDMYRRNREYGKAIAAYGQYLKYKFIKA